MAFVKSENIYEARIFKTFLEAQKVFENLDEDESSRIEALDYILNHRELTYVLETLLKNYSEASDKDHSLIDHAFSSFHTKPKREDDYEIIFKLLESSNAYLRNKAITFLQEYGKSAKFFIQKLLNDKSRDIRIFAVNILGDVKYEDSRDMLIKLIEDEDDINVLMTAIDYIGEIGEPKDIDLLKRLNEKFSNEPYVTFGINLAIDKIKG
ncbi:MAG: HEAT repeat domain-containing protein [Campylobacterota bacterium]|nr:HEAT repeat domain-containing protein [Campylobacterota bacterium]